MQPVVLIVLDGWGYSAETRGNAIAQAKTPTFDRLEREYPFGYLQASGIAVGLPWQEAGNSEVGHLTLGAGRVIEQAVVRINRAIHDGSFFENKALVGAAEHVTKNASALHVAGLFGSGSVHSYLDHLHALLEFAKKRKLERVYLHLFLDGRDSPPKEGASLLAQLQERLKKTEEACVATIIGRHFALDRTFHWDFTKKAYELMTRGMGVKTNDPVASIRSHYDKRVTDEFMEPIVVEDIDGIVRDGDALVFFEFREDSARQLAYSFVAPDKVSGFEPAHFTNLYVVTMTQYEKGLDAHVAFPPQNAKNTLSQVVATAGIKQLKVAETEKYAHATYFFNGGREEPFNGEERKLIPSDETVSLTETPHMKAPEIQQEILVALKEGSHGFIMANFANADMLGHTGNMQATIQAAETIDSMVAPIVEQVLAAHGALVITADHGNAEHMINLINGAAVTAHSTNPVPFYLVSQKLSRTADDEYVAQVKQRIHGVLSDVAPTVLNLLDLEVPPEMTGTSLLGLQ